MTNRDLAYVGGVPTSDFLSIWTTGIRASSPRWSDAEDVNEIFSRHPSYDDYWKKVEIDVESIDLPVFLGAAQMLIFHHRGPYEAWRRLASKEKFLEIVDTNYYSWPNREAVQKLLLFAERHLKGVDNRGQLERVGIQMRIGHGEWYWRTETDWEVPGTIYVDWNLQADASLTTEEPAAGTPLSELPYPADIDPKSKAGLSFVSSPFQTDVELAGHFTATLNISSTSHDADVVVSLWALDEEGKIVRFCVGPNNEPFASGLLRASHRKTDPNRSLPWRPWHTHREEDLADLKGGEVVELDVEICLPPLGSDLAGDFGPTSYLPKHSPTSQVSGLLVAGLGSTSTTTVQ
ncbi:hypothetical protein ACJZ2D_011995 [Fusarium nematophilum]